MIINIISLLLLINSKIAAITSASIAATTEAAHQMEIISTTEGLDIVTKAEKITTEGPYVTNLYEIPTADLKLDDIERQIKNIFFLKTPTTSAPKVLDELSSVEIVNGTGQKLTLGRRTDFRTRRNCHCIIHNRCAKTDSCLKEKPKKKKSFF